jgi:hypothetical protein
MNAAGVRCSLSEQGRDLCQLCPNAVARSTLSLGSEFEETAVYSFKSLK